MATVHVIPNADLIEHDPTDDCICGPTFEQGPTGRVAVHPSLDGREKKEHGRNASGSA